MRREYEEKSGRADGRVQVCFKGVTRLGRRLANTMILPAIHKMKNILD